MTPGSLSASYPEFTPGLESSKTLFSLNPGVTRDSRVTPRLPLDSKTGHNSSKFSAVALRHSVNCRYNCDPLLRCFFFVYLKVE